MYICVCNAVTESAIRKAVRNGAHTINELSFATGCGTQCGSCVPQTREILNETLAESGQERGPTALRVVSCS